MKTLIVAINSKFIHTSLAAWYLKSSCGDGCGEVSIAEYTINDSLDTVFADIYRAKADVVAFSCYIWNISHVHLICENLKKVQPGITIILGGPEVSFDGGKILEEHPSIDFILSGEGEEVFPCLLSHLKSGSKDWDKINGLAFRSGQSVIYNEGFNLIEDLGRIPSPYTEEVLSGLSNKIIYYESSRGCPFFCSYCISSTFKGVRYFSMDRVRSDLLKLIHQGVKQIKFVDRTFNCNKQRAMEIFDFIIELALQRKAAGEDLNTNFHFEAAADLFDEEVFEVLSKAPRGLIQFEIGIQTTNLQTLELIHRKTDLKKLFYNVERLKSLGNIHLHLDLIAGLPAEDYHSFIRSFNEVYRLKPDQLQLGFLKMLKGSSIRVDAEKYGYGYRSYPPYEVFYNDFISFDELLELKGIEEVLDRYYNSGRFVQSIGYLIQNMFSSPFDFYKAFFSFFKTMGYLDSRFSSRQLYSILIDFLNERVGKDKAVPLIKELLKLDYLSSDNSNNLPDGIERNLAAGFKEMCFEFLKSEENIKKYLPDFCGMPAKQIFKQVHFEIFRYDVLQEKNSKEQKDRILLFDYSNRDRVTERYQVHELTGFNLPSKME
ncbi:MAG: B12-binding domain-containing radical SAM protein [Clostridia bacterium]|nr:B12-binding domain-containing radical SAM protein [Clostridia bacterium]